MDPANLGVVAGIIALMIPIVAIIGGIAVAISAVISRSKIRQLEIRQRIAMIEKGLVPPPEKDPLGFDRAMSRLERHEYHDWPSRRAGRRHRQAGITIMGVGLGLMVLIRYAGEEPGAAIGVGGFLVLVGLAFLINSFFERDEPSRTPDGPAHTDQSPPASGS